MLRCHRFLDAGVGLHAGEARRRPRGAGRATAPAGGEEERDKTEHLRVKLAQWCENGGGADHRGHGGARDAQRGAQRDAPVRPHQGLREAGARAPAGALERANLEALLAALALLAQMLAPFAPHIAEELWLALGDEDERRTNAVARRIVPGAGMSTQTAQPPQGSRQRTRSCATALRLPPLRAQLRRSSDTVFSCPDCGKGLDVVYDYELAARHFREVPARRAPAATSGTSRSCCRSWTRARRRGWGSTPATRR